MKLLRLAILTCLLAVAPLQAEFVTIGKYQAKILPEQAASLSFPTKGVITDLIRPDNKRIEKDTVIAVLDKDKLLEAREDMELQLKRERLTKQDEIRKLELQRSQMDFYLKLTPKERVYARDIKGESSQEAPEASAQALKDIDERIDLLRRELSTLERRKRNELETKFEKNTLKMPFSGRLQYNFVLPENLDEPFEYTQNLVAQAFATVCDDSAFYIAISISNPDLTLLPEERFSAYIELPTGRRITGTYAFRRVERSSGSDMLAYYFRLDPDDHDTALNMLGSSASAMLVYSIEETVERVPKIKLLSHPAAPNCEDWKQLVSVVYPGYVIVLVTERDILIRKQKASDTNS